MNAVVLFFRKENMELKFDNDRSRANIPRLQVSFSHADHFFMNRISFRTSLEIADSLRCSTVFLLPQSVHSAANLNPV